VEPSEVVAGEEITVTADTACDVPVPDGGWVVVVSNVGRPDLAERTPSTEPFDGTYELSLTTPAHLVPGDAFVSIENWDYSACDDTGSGASGSCAAASGDFVVIAG
jgi:hypothetical protein